MTSGGVRAKTFPQGNLEAQAALQRPLEHRLGGLARRFLARALACPRTDGAPGSWAELPPTIELIPHSWIFFFVMPNPPPPKEWDLRIQTDGP